MFCQNIHTNKTESNETILKKKDNGFLYHKHSNCNHLNGKCHIFSHTNLNKFVLIWIGFQYLIQTIICIYVFNVFFRCTMNSIFKGKYVQRKIHTT